MTRDEERLTLVIDFGSLRQGDLVVVKRCAWGCRDHFGILLKLHVDATCGWASPNGGRGRGNYDTWEMSGECAGEKLGVAAVTVANRCVYRVDTGLTRDIDTHEAAPVKKPRELAKVAR